MIPIILFILSVQGQNPDFLRIPVFARPTAIGSAYTSVSDDAAAIFYNPAGINSAQTSVNLTEWLLETRFAALASYYRFKNAFLIGIGFYYFSYGTIDQYDENENLIGNFSPYSYVAIITMAKPIIDNLSIGISGKFFSEKILETENKSWAGDIGVKFSQSLFNVGADIKNFSGTNRSFIKEIGFSLKPIKSLLACVDLSHYTKFTLRAGIEYKVTPVSFRLGLNDSKPTFGIGYTHKSFSFDYAAIDFPNLGLVHEFSIGLGIK
jgi:hypothetical protein